MYTGRGFIIDNMGYALSRLGTDYGFSSATSFDYETAQNSRASCQSWIIDGRGLSRKVINASASASCQIKDSGATLECPYCHRIIHNNHLSEYWPGLPVGVKFDPSDFDLLDHLASKCEYETPSRTCLLMSTFPRLKAMMEFATLIQRIFLDGTNIHFFYRTFNAYATGCRKRRKRQDAEGHIKEVRWHKTGKTKALLENGVPKGYKKIMVLYSSVKNGGKAGKCSWVMHQYHLGADEDEKEGDYVV